MIIVTDSNVLEKSINRYFEFVLSGMKFDNLVLVDLNSDFSSAREYASNKDNKVILFGIENIRVYEKDPKFRLLMALSNVEFINALEMCRIPEIYNKISSGEKKEDATSATLASFQILEREISAVCHGIDFDADIFSEDIQKRIARARVAGLTGTDKEIFEYLKNWRPDEHGAFEGKRLEGIFVDALDTLFDREWNVIPGIFAFVEKMRVGRHSVTVISDSDAEIVKRALKKADIEWKLLSKFDLRGATLEIVVDNLSREEFFERHRISAETFVSVSDIL